MSPQPKSNEILISRFLQAPVEAVWDAWTDETQAAQWWGPRGFTIVTHSKDFKVGGHWHYTMTGPDGATYINKTRYLEVVPQEKLVYDHGGNDERKPLFRVTVTFKSVKGGTQMDMTMACPTPEDAEQTRGFIKKAGGNATWDRFTEYLRKKQTGQDTFVINRSFDAPIGVMWEMWTDPGHISKWLPPVGFTMKILEGELKVGGKIIFSMTADNGGMSMYGRIDTVKMEKPHTLISTQQFLDEKRNISRHPMAPVYPETVLRTVQFTEEGKNQTRVTVTWEPVGSVKPEELAVFIKMRAGMTQGWTGSFDKLEDYLGKIAASK